MAAGSIPAASTNFPFDFNRLGRWILSTDKSPTNSGRSTEINAFPDSRA
jgi:hypothetical protein